MPALNRCRHIGQAYLEAKKFLPPEMVSDLSLSLSLSLFLSLFLNLGLNFSLFLSLSQMYTLENTPISVISLPLLYCVCVFVWVCACENILVCLRVWVNVRVSQKLLFLISIRSNSQMDIIVLLFYPFDWSLYFNRSLLVQF